MNEQNEIDRLIRHRASHETKRQRIKNSDPELYLSYSALVLDLDNIIKLLKKREKAKHNEN